MKDQLQLQEIAGYLPYKLRIQHADQNKVMNLGKGSSVHWIGLSAVIDWHNSAMKAKPYPVLRPMSDLTKEITHNGKTFTPVFWLEDFYDNLDLHEQAIQLSKDYRWVNQSDYMLIMHLIEWHFDIHNLIGQGKAISIHDTPTK